MLIMEFRFDAILYSNMGNENSDTGHIKCSRGPQVPQPWSQVQWAESAPPSNWCISFQQKKIYSIYYSVIFWTECTINWEVCWTIKLVYSLGTASKWYFIIVGSETISMIFDNHWKIFLL